MSVRTYLIRGPKRRKIKELDQENTITEVSKKPEAAAKG
jgi:hypothetical protein